MRILTFLAQILFFMECLTSLYGQSFPQRTFDPNKATNPYSLVDLDNFNLGDYESSRWGVWQDMTSGGIADLKFDALTNGKTQQELESELFLTSSLQSLSFIPFTSPLIASRTWYPATSISGGYVHVLQPTWYAATQPFTTLHLLRKLHFQNYLDGMWGSPAISPDAEKLIILIHGWNRTAESWGYGDEFASLADYIESKLQDTEWKVSLYHWEADAATGGGKLNLGQGPDPVDPTEAVTVGHSHGEHLGELLKTYNKLRKVHLISHSAGAWVARAAAKELLQNSNIQVQITFLDPFVPGVMKDKNNASNNTPFQTELLRAYPRTCFMRSIEHVR